MLRVGLISDTHSLLRVEAQAAMKGCDYIVHAGDIGDASILAKLAALAPVTAIRGNNDKGAWAQSIPASSVLSVGGIQVYVLHDLGELNFDPVAAGFRVVISGHSHRALIQERGGVLYVNPGSAGPRRFKLPVSVAELRVAGTSVHAQIHELGPGAA
jgi:uncharacterized protein